MRNREKAGGWLKQPVFYIYMYFSQNKKICRSRSYASVNRTVRPCLALDQTIDDEVHDHNEDQEHTCTHVGVH